MAGSILGKDQIALINSLYPRLVAHVRELLSKDQTAYGLMKAHVAAECLDSTELAAIFKPLGFISPAEKRALVRAAILETMAASSKLFEAVKPADAPRMQEGVVHETFHSVAYQPPKLNLNPATTMTPQEAAPRQSVVETKPPVTSAVGKVDHLKAAERSRKLEAQTKPAVVE